MKLNSGKDVFVKIKGMIGDMIEKLEQEAAEAAELKLSSKLDIASAECVIVYKKDTTLAQTKEFDAQIQVLDVPNEIKVGYSLAVSCDVDVPPAALLS